jgi:hypothetical protein
VQRKLARSGQPAASSHLARDIDVKGAQHFSLLRHTEALRHRGNLWSFLGVSVIARDIEVKRAQHFSLLRHTEAPR